MFTTDARKVKKRSIYFADGNRLVDADQLQAQAEAPSAVVDAAGATIEARVGEPMEREAAAAMLAELAPAVEETLVTKVSLAITMSMPPLPSDRVHHALFNKHLYLAGEITVQAYLQKMRNLFPERMEALAPDLRAAVANILGEAH